MARNERGSSPTAARQQRWSAIKPMSKKKTSKRAKRGGSSCAATLLAGEQKCPVCHDLGIIRNDQSDQGWDDCNFCEPKTCCPCCWEMVYPQKIRNKETGALVCNKCNKCGGTWS